MDWQRVDTSTLDADDVFQQDAFEVYDKTPITPLLPGTIELELYIHSFIVIDADFAWCQHCNSVRPTLALLAQKLKDIRILSANLVEHRELRHNLNYTCGEMCKLTVFNRETPNEVDVMLHTFKWFGLQEHVPFSLMCMSITVKTNLCIRDASVI